MQTLGDANIMLDGGKLQICESEVGIARLAEALREVTKKAESNPKKRLIDYPQELSRSNTPTTFSEEASSHRRCKKSGKKLKRNRTMALDHHIIKEILYFNILVQQWKQYKK